MPVTFGSVGDIISLSLLIKTLVKSLDKSRGSSAEYQAVIRELRSLDHALLEVEALVRSFKQSIPLNALSATINECVEQCRGCITRFHEQVEKFGKSLRLEGSDNIIRDIASKFRWQVSEKEDLARFRVEINAHCFSVSMLLTMTGVIITQLNDENLRTSLKQIQQSSLNSSAIQTSEMIEIKSRLEENNALVKVAASETKALSSRFDMSYFKNLGADILLFMQKMWKVNILTYQAVLSLQSSVPAQLDRCWTQESIILEDALGRVTPIHLEFLDSWEAFEAVLEVRFRQLPGHRKIQQREYTLQITSLRKDIERSLAFNRCFLPGQRIDMSMIFEDENYLSSCPSCSLATNFREKLVDSRVQCPSCQIWYQQLIITNMMELKAATRTESKIDIQGIQLPMPLPQKLQRTHDEECDNNPAQFRRVRLNCRAALTVQDWELPHGSVVSEFWLASPDLSVYWYVQALYDYESNDGTTLNFRQGDIIQLREQLASGWWDGVIKGVYRGWFPSNYCVVLPDQKLLQQMYERDMTSYGGKD